MVIPNHNCHEVKIIPNMDGFGFAWVNRPFLLLFKRFFLLCNVKKNDSSERLKRLHIILSLVLEIDLQFLTQNFVNFDNLRAEISDI